MLKNSRTVRIEWGDCDPAGIVHYPRYFSLFDASTTALLERAAGMTKFQMTKTFDFVGFPMVDTRGKFHKPSRYCDDVVIESTISELKRSSFSVEHRLFNSGELAVEGFETRVWVGRDPSDPQKIKAKPIPEALAARLRQD